MGDDISTDGILKGSWSITITLQYSRNKQIPYYDPTFYDRAIKPKEHEGYCVIAGDNFAQGSSREHAALAPKYLGQKFAIAKSYARIGWQNLINFGIVPLSLRKTGKN
jgi:aconitate hydratase